MLPMRAVVDAATIFSLTENKPEVITCRNEKTTLLITNGFNTSKKLTLKYEPGCSYFFKVNGVVDNAGLYTALGISLLLFIVYIFVSVKILLILANIPLLVLIYFFFINPGQSIELKSWIPPKDTVT